jgi:hypothetical protein
MLRCDIFALHCEKHSEIKEKTDFKGARHLKFQLAYAEFALHTGE